MPLTEDGYLKFIRDILVKTTVLHQTSNTRVSRQPETAEGTEWTDPANLPQKLQDEMSEVIDSIFEPAEAHGMQPEMLRLCWEPMAPDENWFAIPHPRCAALYIATAGTGHAFKFLPIIGELIADVLLQPEIFKLNEMSEMWAWDRKLVDSPDEDVIPKRELADMT
jgi:sarcosine oxidase/L-pipecolate oxidase